MELDEVKKIWNEMDSLNEKQLISDNRLKDMLKNKGKTALSKLIKAARFYIFAEIPLGLIFCLLSYNFFEAGGYYVICPLSFLLICILIVPLEIYLYRLLKSIDFSSMSVKEVSERILKYQDIIQKSQMYGTVVFFVYLGVWYYLYYRLIYGSEIDLVFIVFIAVIYFTFGLIGLPVAFKKLYYNNINRIKESLKELKEFEEL